LIARKIEKKKHQTTSIIIKSHRNRSPEGLKKKKRELWASHQGGLEGCKLWGFGKKKFSFEKALEGRRIGAGPGVLHKGKGTDDLDREGESKTLFTNWWGQE